jgi:predicted AAA+ superfamily ATPase
MPNTAPDRKRPVRPARADTAESSFRELARRAEAVLSRLEALLPPEQAPIDWSGAIAFRWRKRLGRGVLKSLPHPPPIALSDLIHIEPQKRAIERNTRQFLAGYPANNVLLTGARGTGKSSLIKACLNRFAKKGLRVIEVDRTDLIDLPDIVALIEGRPERFIIFCDDLSFEEGDAGFKTLKVALDGSMAGHAENMLIYATSNRRHLMPEQMRENLTYTHTDDGEIHPGEGVEEKISLSERFGLWVSFYPFKQDEYLEIVAHWLTQLGCEPRAIGEARDEALRFALERGSRSGRVAWQFARAFAGARKLRGA